MYIKKEQVLQIREGVERIKELSNIENCGIELDENTRYKMKLYLKWFETYASDIEKVLDNKLIKYQI